MQNNLLVGLSRQIALQREMDVVANNMANMNTDGFKAEGMIFNDYMKTPAKEDTFQPGDRSVHFVVDRGTYHNMNVGPAEQTGGTFHLALKDENTYFAIQTKQGERYTRAGNFERNSEGKMVTANGDPVLGAGGEITFGGEEIDVNIANDGTISTNQGNKGKVKVVTFANPQQLEKIGDNLFAAGKETSQPVEFAGMKQGYIERSNVRPVKEMSRMLEVNRSYASLASIMDKMHEVQKTSIERLGSVRA